MQNNITMKTKWTIDPAHSEVQFKVKHLVISTVTGSFGSFNAEAETEGDDFDNANVQFSADIDSIHTGNEQRDGHLKSPDFFDAANHPRLSFVATSMKKAGGNNYKLAGNLTLRGVTKPVEFNVEHGGIMKDPYGNTKSGFELTGTIKRKDFGLTWNAATEAGGVVVSEDVKLIANIQLAKAQ